MRDENDAEHDRDREHRHAHAAPAAPHEALARSHTNTLLDSRTPVFSAAECRSSACLRAASAASSATRDTGTKRSDSRIARLRWRRASRHAPPAARAFARDCRPASARARAAFPSRSLMTSLPLPAAGPCSRWPSARRGHSHTTIAAPHAASHERREPPGGAAASPAKNSSARTRRARNGAYESSGILRITSGSPSSAVVPSASRPWSSR